MLLTEMTMVEFQERLKKTQTVLVPFGAIEEHGSHLPLFTDAFIVEEVLKKVTEERAVFLAPTIYYGVCTSTRSHAGTIGITPETLRRLTRDLIKEFYQKGLKNIFLVSGHAGGIHMSAMKEAAEMLIEEMSGTKLAVFSLYDFMWEDVVSIAETKNDSHAGEIETSLVLALAPELVKGTAPEEYPQFPKPFIVSNKLHYWPGGVWGNPEKASSEKGRQVFDLMVDKIVKFLDKI